MTPKFNAPKSSAPCRIVAKVIVLCALVVALFTPSWAQQPLSLAEADQRASTIFQQSGTTGMVLVAVRNQEVLIKAYGEAIPGSGHAPDANSLIRHPGNPGHPGTDGTFPPLQAKTPLNEANFEPRQPATRPKNDLPRFAV
jgi:hypothetical protein